MSQRTTFPPVYPDLAKSGDFHQGWPKFSAVDTRLIVSVVGSSAIITHLCQHAIRHAAEFIRTNDLTIADYERFADYIRERSAPAVVTAKTVAPNVAGRDQGKGKPAAGAPNKRPVAR